MGKSLEFIKNRIESENVYGFEDTHFETLTEFNSMDMLEKLDVFKKSNGNLLCKFVDGRPDLKIHIIYDDNADFDYFTMDSCCCDGTLYFAYAMMENCIAKILRLETYNKEKKIPEDLSGYEITYTVGNFVLGTEYSEKFATKEKPWMLERFTAMLPIKFDIE